MTGPTPPPTPEPSAGETGPTPGSGAVPTPELVALAEAATIAGVTVGALRKRYQAGDLERHYDSAGRVLLDPAAVRLLYQKPPPPEARSAAQTEAPEGSVLVPLSAWEQVLTQLGNLHQAGQELAEARERAARAEERETFAQERRREAETRARDLEAQLADRTPSPSPSIPSEPAERRRWWQRKP